MPYAATPDRTPTPMPAHDPGAALACLQWLAECSALMVEHDPTLNIDAADRIAGILWSNERLRNLPPADAVDFLFAHPEARAGLAP